MRDHISEEVKDGVVRDYLRGDKVIVIHLEYKISNWVIYRILHARNVKLRKPKGPRPYNARKTQRRVIHPLFFKYRREFLHEATGYSKGYLCRVANGKTALSRAFIERVCFNLQMPKDELFFPEAGEVGN